MPEIIPPIPDTLPAISDTEFDHLVKRRKIVVPKWESRRGKRPHPGYSHINANCETCKGVGAFIGLGLREYLCPCLDQYTLYSVFAAAEIQPDLRKLRVEDADGLPGASLDLLGEWMQERQTGNIILIGASFSGKTLMASLIMRAYLKRGDTAYLTRPDQMRDDATAGFESDEAKDRYVRKVRSVDLLVIDEMGRVGTTTEFMQDNLARILRERENALLPTLLISHENLDWLTKKYYGSADILADTRVHRVTSSPYGQKEIERSSYEERQGITRPMVLE